MTIRRAVPDDARSIAIVHVESWQAAYKGMLPSDYLDSLSTTIDRRTDFWRAHIEDGMAVHVAEQEEVVGFVNTGLSETGDTSELFAIYVQPDHWGQGHGHALLGAAEAHLRTLSPATAVLWVLEDNTQARTFYERHAWALSNRMAVLNIGGADVTEVRYEKNREDL